MSSCSAEFARHYLLTIGARNGCSMRELSKAGGLPAIGETTWDHPQSAAVLSDGVRPHPRRFECSRRCATCTCSSPRLTEHLNAHAHLPSTVILDNQLTAEQAHQGAKHAIANDEVVDDSAYSGHRRPGKMSVLSEAVRPTSLLAGMADPCQSIAPWQSASAFGAGAELASTPYHGHARSRAMPSG